MNIFQDAQKPFLKWPGGKSSELSGIAKASPSGEISRYIDPFVGGGSVLFAVNPQVPALANDACSELVNLYEAGKNQDFTIRLTLEFLSRAWSQISSFKTNFEEIARDRIEQRDTSIKNLASMLKSIQSIAPTSQNLIFDNFRSRIVADLESKMRRVEILQVRNKRELPFDELTINIESSIKSSFYMSVRQAYNQLRLANSFSKDRDAYFFFLREYSYASMFRFNSAGEFNVPYGGISYNNKNFQLKIDHLFSEDLQPRLRNTTFTQIDFEQFLHEVKPSQSDFIFVDPPYDSDFSNYDNRDFVSSDQSRLTKVLENLSSKVMVVIGDTPLVRSLYSTKRWRISELNLNYKWTIKNRNSRQARHLTITNY